MKKALVFTLVMAFLASALPVFAAEGGEKGASSRAYERAGEEAIFNRIGDWFSTIGKSEEEKKAIIAERKAERVAIRAQKEAEKQKRKLEREEKKAKRRLKKRLRKQRREKHKKKK